MATTKKSSTTKKKAAPKAAATTKKRVVKKSTTKPSAAAMQSFKVAKEKQFLTFEPTIQTVYWLVLAVIVLAFGFWILKLQSDIHAIYDQIDANNAESLEAPLPKKQAQ